MPASRARWSCPPPRARVAEARAEVAPRRERRSAASAAPAPRWRPIAYAAPPATNIVRRRVRRRTTPMSASCGSTRTGWCRFSPTQPEPNQRRSSSTTWIRTARPTSRRGNARGERGANPYVSREPSSGVIRHHPPWAFRGRAGTPKQRSTTRIPTAEAEGPFVSGRRSRLFRDQRPCVSAVRACKMSREVIDAWSSSRTRRFRTRNQRPGHVLMFATATARRCAPVCKTD